MAAKEKKTEATATATAPKKATPRRSASKKEAAAEITHEMIAERAYHISESGEGGTDEENWHRAEAELRGA
jgi:hypothetical protein